MLALTLVASLAAALPDGAVVLGISTNDGTSTTLRMVALDGAARDVASIAHRPGMVPQGVVDGGAVLLTVDRGGTGASVVRVSLDDGTVADVGDGAVATQAPMALHDGVAFVRAGRSATSFDVVVLRGAAAMGAATSDGGPATPGRGEAGVPTIARGAAGRVVATIDAASVTPVVGARDLQLLVVGANGVGRIVRVGDDGVVQEVAALGKGPLRAPCDTGARVVVERDVPVPIDRKPLADVRARALGKARVAGASLVDVRTGKTIASAVLPGMSPVCGGGVVAYTTGAKDGALFLDGKPTKLRAGSKGIARPQAIAVVDGKVVVVVRIDSGAARPAETWRLVEGDTAARLSDPAPGAVVQVYGVVHAIDAAAR